jgi:hypothetical protein
MSAQKSIPFYYEKLNYLISRKNGAFSECPIAKEKHNMRHVIITDLHHAGIHNTKVSRKLYPNVVHSIINLIPVNNFYHIANGSYGRKSEMWAKKWQKFLENPIHKKCNKFVNEIK